MIVIIPINCLIIRFYPTNTPTFRYCYLTSYEPIFYIPLISNHNFTIIPSYFHITTNKTWTSSSYILLLDFSSTLLLPILCLHLLRRRALSHKNPSASTWRHVNPKTIIPNMDISISFSQDLVIDFNLNCIIYFIRKQTINTYYSI